MARRNEKLLLIKQIKALDKRNLFDEDYLRALPIDSLEALLKMLQLLLVNLDKFTLDQVKSYVEKEFK